MSDNVPAYSPAPTVKHQCPAVAGDTRDAVFAGILLILSLTLAYFLLFGGGSTGYAGVLVLLLTAIWVYAMPAGEMLRPYTLLSALLLYAGAAAFAFTGDSALLPVLTLWMAVIFAAAFSGPAGLEKFDVTGFGVIPQLFALYLIYPMSNLGTAIRAIFLKKEGEEVRKRKCGPVLIGLGCAVPMLLILVPLLISSDAAFEAMMERTVFAKAPEKLIVSLFFGLILFIFLFSLLFTARRKLQPLPEKADPDSLRKLPPAAVITFLGCISLFYVLYLVSQGAYFFSAFSGLLPKNFTPAQYARRGFFEMSAICAIDLVLVVGTDVFSRKNPVIRALNTFLSGFSLILIATAVSKMALYVRYFGMTRLRILTTLFMAVLAVTFLAVILRLYIRKFPLMRVVIVFASVVLLLACYANIDRQIARYNISAYRSGAIAELDTETLNELDVSAVPELIVLLEDGDETVRQDAGYILGRHWSELEDGEDGFLYTSLPQRRARRALEPYAKEVTELWNNYCPSYWYTENEPLR